MNDIRTRRVHPGVLALAVTSFAIGVAEFVVVGILPAIAGDLKVSLDRAGELVGLYALALAVGTPLVVLALARFPRKPVLLGLVAVFMAGNLLSAMSVDYASLLVGRVVTAVAHGSFFAIGATVAAALAPRDQASRAIAIMFSGLTLAMVIGVPLGSILGNGMGWRLPFFAVAALAALALMATAWWLPPMPAPRVGRMSAQLAALGQPSILAMMCVTILGFGSSFAAFTFITPILTGLTGFSSTAASVLLVVFGAATLVGNLAGGRFASSLGWQSALRLLFALLGATLAVIGLSLSHPLPMVVMLFIWGVLAFGMSPGVQAAMLETAERDAPQAVDFASGLNISSFNLGISLGETVGGALVAHGHLGLTPWAGVISVVAAQVPLAWMGARARRAGAIGGMA
ncbi:MFS transporter [Gluconacetobacter azotocaptans]|uniref:MFS transporter n=1 Tax=Gluconacetobacter azotocaptans TaxID=142834 RepID=A0A7W4JQ02_9PROT|nr:MFS transporter [Gluconacetobacter azotocaptans]MBB2188662.1 MFS transporter [Gluconacetobacter azotocaptans]MBM9400424.1 MFS transporter [Gluconacetobacter azotocaptans]GBQ35180.1 arabinose efflux permease [Gluconacetobacter azotocaptans DSM 13594]